MKNKDQIIASVPRKKLRIRFVPSPDLTWTFASSTVFPEIYVWIAGNDPDEESCAKLRKRIEQKVWAEASRKKKR